MIPTIQKWLFAIAFFTFTITTFASNYYASPTGTGVGTVDDPCDIATGFALSVNPGDTLFLRGGVYYFNAKQSINKNGTVDARIAIMAYAGEVPILDFSAEPYGSSFPGISLHASSTYMHLKGLTIRYAGDNGLINNGNFHIIENCVFYGNCDSGLQHKTGGGNLIKNCDSYLNYDYQTGGVAAADFGGNADGFADKQYTSANPNTYEGCRAWFNADDGWDFYQKYGSSTLKNCICYRNGITSFNLSSLPRLTTDAVWFAQFPRTVTNADGGTDLITLEKYLNYGNGNGFKLGGEFTTHDVTVTNCLSVAHKKVAGAGGYHQNNNAGSMTLYNCSAYDNYYNYAFFPANALDGINSADLTIKNSASLLSVSGSNYFAIPNLVSTNNTWLAATAVSCTSADYLSIDSTGIISPRQIDGSLPNIVFMQLVDGSDLINKGVDVGIPYNGIAPDLGCFEKVDFTNFPGAVTCPNNRNQGIPLGGALENIVFKWSAGATGLTASGLPAGVSAIENSIAKTLTISGTPESQGDFSYVISTTGGTGSPATVNGKIVVASATSKKIAYVTTINNAADSLILAKLNANEDFVLTPIEAVTSNAYTNYDLIIISPVPNVGSAGLPIIELVNKPKLLLKPSLIGTSRWNWGTSASTSVTSINVSNKTHEIFNGLTFSGTNNDELQLFSQSGAYAVNGVSSFVGTPVVSSLAKVTGKDTMSIVEIPLGTNMNGYTVNSRLIIMGLSEYSMTYLTPTATQLIENACYYLMGLTVKTEEKNEIAKPHVRLIQTDSEIYVETSCKVKSLELYHISGLKVCTSNNSQIPISGLLKGVYLLHVITDASEIVQKVLIY